MSDKIWLRSYPPGMPAEIGISPFSSVPELLEDTIRRYADKPAFHNLGHTISFSELDRLSRDLAAYLQSLSGLTKGERVAIMLPNLLQYPVVLFGILRAGMTVVRFHDSHLVYALTWYGLALMVAGAGWYVARYERRLRALRTPPSHRPLA